jgi:glycosyltransferase domain-containing protein
MENLTIIIPSNNRPFFLRRSINYWNNYNFPVIIVDGSNDTQKKWMDENSNKNIQYFHEKISFPQRLSLAGKLIKTKYAILLSDDEFYSVDALKTCVNFLESNNEYVAVNGRAVGFLNKNNKLLGEVVYPEWAGRKLVEDDPIERMKLHMKDYANTLGVSVTESTLWSKCADLYANNEFAIFAQWELQMNLILSFSGKSKTLDVLMYYRSLEDETPPIHNIIKNHIPSLNCNNQIYKIWFEAKHEKLKTNFINITSSFMASLKPELNLNYCKVSLIACLDKYVNDKNSRQKKKIFLAFFYLISKIPQNIKKLIIKFLLKFKINKYKSLIEVVNFLESQGTRVNHKDLDQIISTINFSKKIKEHIRN